MEIFYLDENKVASTDSLENIDKRKITWIRFLDKDPEKIKELSKFANIPEEEFEEFFDFEERSRLEQGRYLELTYQVPCTNNGEIETSTINLFVINNLFITVERQTTPSMAGIASLMRKGKLKFLFKESITNMLYYFLDKINDSFMHSIDRITNLTDILEAKGGNISDKQLMGLYNNNVTLTRFNQAILANLEVLAGLRKSYYKKFTKEDLDNFADLYYEKLQILDTEKIQREVITNLFNFQSVVSTKKLNNFIKLLTSLTVLIMVPTFITGLFGMNVPVPLANNPYAFIIILAGLIVFSGILFFIFKKAGWL